MAHMYFIDIDGGVLRIHDAAPAPSLANEFLAPNAKQYFAARGKPKPKPIKVRGWTFKNIYMVVGDEENGMAVAWG